MTCERWRDALSALLDHEDPGIDQLELQQHLQTCTDCRTFERDVAALHRVTRVRSAEPVPDLSGAIMATIAPRANPHDVVLGWLRSGLTFVGVLVVARATALLLSNTAENPAHLAAWDLAFGGALLFAAWQPERARGMLPMALLLIVSMTTASLIEINDGHPASHGLVFHVTELLGVVLLALLARHRHTRGSRARLSPT
jgi:predicted anti-sigma-YlaC factor YlaD